MFASYKSGYRPPVEVIDGIAMGGQGYLNRRSLLVWFTSNGLKHYITWHIYSWASSHLHSAMGFFVSTPLKGLMHGASSWATTNHSLYISMRCGIWFSWICFFLDMFFFLNVCYSKPPFFTFTFPRMYLLYKYFFQASNKQIQILFWRDSPMGFPESCEFGFENLKFLVPRYTQNIWLWITLPETNIAPENGWLEDYFQGQTVSFVECMITWNK